MLFGPIPSNLKWRDSLKVCSLFKFFYTDFNSFFTFLHLVDQVSIATWTSWRGYIHSDLLYAVLNEHPLSLIFSLYPFFPLPLSLFLLLHPTLNKIPVSFTSLYPLCYSHFTAPAIAVLVPLGFIMVIESTTLLLVHVMHYCQNDLSIIYTYIYHTSLPSLWSEKPFLTFMFF